MYYSSSMGVGSYITLKVVLAVALLVTTVVPPPCEASTDRLISTILGSAADNDDENRGTIWAVLVAGSNGYENYRHQADICHAYQLLKDGGLKDENIIVFMYDDIAYNKENPRQGIIINHPNGSDVYSGVPKDYTGEEVNAQNFYQVLLGNKSGVVGGSGKVVKSKPNDVIFLYYADHGATGLLSMPTGPYVYADELIKVLRKKHKAGTYKKMVIYVEACESGSMFEGLLGDDWNIYAMTASNAEESSYAWYCPGSYPPPPPEYETCLGDLFSIGWMEDSDGHNRKKERIKEQFKKVKERTKSSSHVKEYGSIKDITNDKLSDYQGYHHPSSHYPNHLQITNLTITVDQRDAELLYLWEKYKRLGEKNSEMKEKVLKEMAEKVQHRAYIDKSVGAIGDYLFGTHKSHSILKSVTKPGLPVVDNWECLKSMVKIFEEECGALGEYGKKHVRAFANICNHGISSAAMRKASITACAGRSKQ